MVVGGSVVDAAASGSVDVATGSMGGAGSTGSMGVESTGSIGVESSGSVDGMESSGSMGGSRASGSSSVVPVSVSPRSPLSVPRSVCGSSTDWSSVGSGRVTVRAESSGVSGRAVVCAAEPEIIKPAASTKDPVIGPDLRIVRAVCHHFPNIHRSMARRAATVAPQSKWGIGRRRWDVHTQIVKNRRSDGVFYGSLRLRSIGSST